MSWYWLRVVAVLELVGGAAGLLAVGVEVVGSEMWTVLLPIRLVPATLFLLSLFAGVQLWREKRTGYWASVVVQTIQLPKALTTSFAFMMSFGFDVMVLRVPSPGPAGFGIVFHVSVFEYHLLLWNGLGIEAGVGFSVISCANLGVMLKRLKRGENADLPAADSSSLLLDPLKPLAIAQQPGQAKWVMPFWMRLGVLVFLMFFAVCVGCQVSLISSPR